MQRIIFRTGYSTIIRESKDASAGITDWSGKLVSQAVQLPLHIGVFGPSVEGLFKYYSPEKMNDGDAFLVNHPYLSGSPHLPDVLILTPCFYQDRLFAFCCNIAHKPDLGGMVPGSSSSRATDLFQEGLQLPPVKIVENGMINADIENIIRSNSRVPESILGDIRGQIGCTLIGKKRLVSLADRYGIDTLVCIFEEILSRTKSRIVDLISRCDATVGAEGEGFLDHDGIQLNKPKRIHVKVSLSKSSINFDFRLSDDQAKGPFNMRPNMVKAVCQYATVAFFDPSIPCNNGLYDSVNVITRPGSILDPDYPAPVASYISTTQLVFHVVVSALSKLFPEKAMSGGGGSAAGQISGLRFANKRRWVFYDILHSGQGAKSNADGVSGIAHYMSNVALAPIEVVETEFPIMITRFDLIKDSGGPGKYRGGLGFEKIYHFLENGLYVHRPGTFFVHPPWGLEGGMNGRPAKFSIRKSTGEEVKIDSTPGEFSLEPGDKVIAERPGGGGFGDARERERQSVLDDMADGYISIDSAVKQYGFEEKVIQVED